MTRLRVPPQSISERMSQLAARADSLEKQLLQSQRLATLGTLSMMMAHEINNQLMAVINRADLALSSDSEELRAESLKKILATSELSSSMIRNMMGFASASEKDARRMTAGSPASLRAFGRRSPSSSGACVVWTRDPGPERARPGGAREVSVRAWRRGPSLP